MTTFLGFLAFGVACAGTSWLIIRADAADEERHRRQMAKIVGTAEWFSAQKQPDDNAHTDGAS